MKMIKVVTIIILSAISFVSCSVPVEYDRCTSRSDEGHNIALSKELNNRGIKHKLVGNKLCYNSKNQTDVERASTFVSSFRNGVATILADIETEKQIVEWLTTEQKYYNITQSTDGDRILVILSDSPEDENANREKLVNLLTVK